MVQLRAWTRPSIIGLLIAVTITGCVSRENPLRYPAVLDVEEGGPTWVADLNGDGKDEQFSLHKEHFSPSGRGPDRSVLFEDDQGEVFEQTNYSGDILPPVILDLVGDGRPEVVVPVIRDDSLFVSVASGEGKKLFGFLLATGQPRIEPDGALPWDPFVVGMWALDLDEDGDRELVTVLSTGYARSPRGVFVNALPDGKRLGEVLVGSPPKSPLLGDFDDDGQPELLVVTENTKQGAEYGGFTDMRCYLILFDLTPETRVVWSRALEDGGRSVLAWTDFDGDGSKEVMMARGLGPLRVEILEPGTFRVIRRRTVRGRFHSPVLIDLDRDLRPEVVASGDGVQELVVVDHDLRSVRRMRSPVAGGYGHAWPDLDGDGIGELEFEAPGGFALLHPDLEIKATFQGGSVSGVQQRGPFLPPKLVIQGQNQAMTATLRPNPWFLFVRYGPGLLAVLLPLGAGLLLVHLRRLHYRLRVVHAAGMEALEASGRGLMVLDAQGRIRWRGPGLVAGQSDDRRPPAHLDELARVEPSLARWCREVSQARPARSRSASLALAVRGDPCPESVSMSPVVIGSTRDPHWIVRFDEADRASGRGWPMMAQRIAHAVKNPLTHMLLTVQRLQVEYRERAPAVAGRLDPYADRIQDGIGQLRRLTSSFLKLVDLADPELEDTDLGSLVEGFAETFRAQLPPDIRMHLEIGDEISLARVDREQIHVALDNLAVNAVNALESGGTITLGVAAVSRVRLGASRGPRDFVQIEVMDTGKGVPADAQARVFEPGFTTEEDGSGLGLAIVRKIVEDHDGHISLQSEVGVGTVFTIHLPVAGPMTVEGERA